MKRKKKGIIPKIIVGCLAVYAVVNLLRLQMDINGANTEYDDLSQKIEKQKRENAMLEESVQLEIDDDSVAEVARSELGLVEAGERIFVDISN